MHMERASPLFLRRISAVSILGAALSVFALPLSAGSARAEEPPCGIPPPASPRRIKGGEGIPPLPLPATPLRRSERKRDPAPPLLVGKIRWGRRNLEWKLPDGRTIVYGDWNLDPNDIHGLLQRVTGALKTKYRAEEIDLPGFAFDPREVPILFAAGARPFSPSPEEAKLIGEYLMKGGTLLTVAHHGSRDFTRSIHELAARILPDRPMALLPPDHPIYRAHRRIDRVRYTAATKDRADGAPYFEGVMIGCRVALIHSPYDLNCTWDSDHLTEEHPGVRGEDAFTLGVNAIAYAIAYYPLG
ncbi:MAG: DUF4159 domain-containing protein, partial [Planctomycetes bacterium]|nr:DUF4159 domain-containing protein [Planctomycetota bacterium]